MPARATHHAVRKAAIPDLEALPRTALLDDVDAARALGTTPASLCTWRSTGRHALPFVKLGRNVRYRVGDLLEFIEKRVRLHGAANAARTRHIVTGASPSVETPG